LIARGVPRSAISQTFHGQTSLAVTTGDGVAEAANRRVEIGMSGAGAFAPPDPDHPIRFPTP
jgi:outer membrane protein OmpA-like peptidoglycan-associated protein